MSIKKVQALLDAFEQGKIATLEKHEVSPDVPKGSRENYLYFTVPCALNFQRSSPAMWQSALDTYEDSKTNFVFFPEKVAKSDPEKTKTALSKHKLAIQPNKQSDIWMTISNTLNYRFNADPRKLIKATDNDVLKLIAYLQEHKKEFPYLSGPKLSNYWPYILSLFTDVQWKNPEEISIIPDTHIVQSSIHLGLVPENANPAQVAEAWKSLLKGSGINPAQMHSVLWNWSRANFLPKV